MDHDLSICHKRIISKQSSLSKIDDIQNLEKTHTQVEVGNL